MEIQEYTDYLLTSSTDCDNVITEYNEGNNYDEINIVGDINSPDISSHSRI